MKDVSYYYSGEYGYQFMALHKKSIVYDPRNSNNPIIQDYFDTYDRNNNTFPIYSAVIQSEFDKLKDIELPIVPISFKMIIQEINMSWVAIIHQMVFIENAYNTFYSEYKDVIENILLYDSPDMKESLIYRYYGSGLSIFHVAAKIWIFNKSYRELNNGLITKESMSKAMEEVLKCYGELEDRTNNIHSIVYMTDFRGVTLYDYLVGFIEKFEANQI